MNIKEVFLMEEKVYVNKKIGKREVINNIKDNYKQLEKSIVEQLYLSLAMHGGTIGAHREEIWSQLFEMIIPRKFAIEKNVFIIDSREGVSREVDIAIFDEMYTPYIFRYRKFKFIPIEAVAVVIECKSTGIGGVKQWSEQIEKLETSDKSIVRIAHQISFGSVPTQKATRPIKILCCLCKDVNDEIRKSFDFVISAVKEDKEAYIKIMHPESHLKQWYEELNCHNVKGGEKYKVEQKKLERFDLKDYEIKREKEDNEENISLLSFNFQLNQLLMLINNPMFFPHLDYVDMFNENDNNERKWEVSHLNKDGLL